MTRRIRTALIASAAAALAVPAAGAAIAVPTVPQLADPPQYAIGTSITPSWSASTFTADATGKSYTVEVWDVMTGNHEFIQVNAPDTSHTWTGRQNGHTYRVRVSAQEIRCALKGLGGCLVWNATATSSPYSDWVETRTDTTDPTGSVAINGGAAYTSSRNVTLNLSASDPLSSGVGGVQISTDGAISCNVITDPDECPVGFAAVRPFTLPDGPDGLRPVWVKYRDNARSYAPKGILVSLGAQGNDSPVYTDSIILDRSQPTPVVTMGVPTADAGVPVAFSAASSTDATSGVNTASAVWDFGDGTAPVHALQLNKSFANPGTYNGSLTIGDKAGNTNTQAFSFTVTGAPAPSGGGVEVTDPGSSAPQTTPGGTTVPGPAADDPIRGARRLGRAVQGRTLRIRVKLAERIPVRVTILRVTGAGKAVVRRATKTGGPGFVVFTFTAPKAGRHVVRIAAGSDRLTFPMGIAKR
ncbi:MAG: PKD domain-containing protein [Thermoleophilia bacterium]